MLNYFNKKNILVLIALLLLSFILFSNIVAFSNNCLETYDLGLYFQALVNMANGDLNPYLTVRTLNIFNDHFEPILLFAIPSVWLSGGSPAGVIVFEWLVFVGFIYSLIKIKGTKNILPILYLCLFARGILTALIFPVHPNTWSMIIWLLVVYFIYKNKFWPLLISCFSLILFRESNAFILPGLSIFYFINKNLKKGILSLLFGFMAILIIFKLRPMLFGPTYDYGGVYISGLLDRHIFFIWEQLLEFNFKAFLKVFGPFIVPIIFLVKKDNEKILSSKLGNLVCILSPLFFLHFLAGKIHYHYGITFVAPLLAFVILSPYFEKLVSNKKWMVSTIFLFLLTSTSTYTKWFKVSVLNKTNKCIISSEKRNATTTLKTFIDKNIPLDSTIFSSRRVVPSLMSPSRKYYVPSRFTVHLSSYNYLLMEKNFGGEFRSLTEDRYEKMKLLCENEGSEVLLDTKYFYLLKGKIESKCFSYFNFM